MLPCDMACSMGWSFPGATNRWLAVRNALKFLKTPMIFANNVLQGNLDGAGNTVSRFLVNGITGFGGTVDVAAGSGVPYVKEDFGQTLAVWGFSEGPYLMIPILAAARAQLWRTDLSHP